jgi:hypothetical protein
MDGTSCTWLRMNRTLTSFGWDCSSSYGTFGFFWSSRNSRVTLPLWLKVCKGCLECSISQWGFCSRSCSSTSYRWQSTLCWEFSCFTKLRVETWWITAIKISTTFAMLCSSFLSALHLITGELSWRTACTSTPTARTIPHSVALGLHTPTSSRTSSFQTMSCSTCLYSL